MPYQDITLDCVQCEKEFNFTAGEQEYFGERGFSEPKKCPDCRKAGRKKKRESNRNQIYRSPAFERSAPAHQKIRHSRGGVPGRFRRRHGQDQGSRFDKEYRSPAFREYEKIKPEQEYRSPAFREQDNIIPEEEYRSPGFKEYADIDVKAEYRSPAYRDESTKYIDEKPEFQIICSACGKEAMVPFLPEEKESPMCRECFGEKRKAEIEEARSQKEVEETASTSDEPVVEPGENASSESGEDGLAQETEGMQSTGDDEVS
jgi:CxxC-x17-CxxC domain-containing protein